jgi:hypothetical protein
MKPYRSKKGYKESLGHELLEKFGLKCKWPKYVISRDGVVYRVKDGMMDGEYLPKDWLTVWNPFDDYVAAVELLSVTGIKVSRPKPDSDWVAQSGKRTLKARTFQEAVAGLAWELLEERP